MTAPSLTPMTSDQAERLIEALGLLTAAQVEQTRRGRELAEEVRSLRYALERSGGGRR